MATDLLIFDFDGTLADTKSDIATAVNLTLRQFGLPDKDPEVIYGYVGDGVRMLLQRAFQDEGPSVYDEALRVFRGHYLEHLLDTTRFYPGVEEALEEFRSKKKAVATNKPMEYTQKIIKGLQGEDYFDVVLGGDSTDHLKPHPEIIYRVLERTGSDASKAIMIGDSVNDILAARAAGIRSCAVGYGFGKREDLLASDPDYFCEQAKDLPRLLCDSR